VKRFRNNHRPQEFSLATLKRALPKTIKSGSGVQMKKIAECELEEMFRNNGGNFQKVCKELFEENAGIEYVNCDREAELERMGLTATEMKMAKERKPKQRITLADLVSEQAREIEEDATLPLVEEVSEDLEVVEEETEEDRANEERDLEEEQ